MSESILPPKERGCHRCNFDKKCRDLVVDELCGRWAKIDTEPSPGKTETTYMCSDDLALGVAIRTQKMLGHLADAVEKMAEEGRQHHKAALAVNTALTQAAIFNGKKAEHLIEHIQEQLPLMISADNAAPLGTAPPE